MSQKVFVIEKGLKIVDVGTDVGVEHLQGSGAPSLDAPIGSLYSDRDTGSQYQKIAAGAGAGNWEKLATTNDVAASIGTWRPERVVLLTDEAQGAGVRDVVLSPFSDDEGTPVALADFVVGKHIIAAAVLLEITDVTGDNVTFALAASPMVKDDTFVVEYYLPDTELQEGPAIVNYNGSAMVKIADADWGRADGIGLAPSYAAVEGLTVDSADTVQSALEKLDGNQIYLTFLSGEPAGSSSYSFDATNTGLNEHGVFYGDDVLYNSNTKAVLQELGRLAGLSNQWTQSINTPNMWAQVFRISTYYNQIVSVKLAMHIQMQKAGLTLPNVCLELLMTAFAAEIVANSTSDFTVYGKLKIDMGVPSTGDYDPEFRIVVTQNLINPDYRDVALEINMPADANICTIKMRPTIISETVYG